ncbi:four helix bundle protein [Desulfonatronum sp. SC1]|uniref:four helix bundle protein n=1 Tax=Desulfonatronum sp. SC1 TaxID=2109626 RepID=UPI000D314E47|nr:four helix bundle protein [Desulfonatronum sp. SC1]
MSDNKGFRCLRVWEKARDLAVLVYDQSREGPFTKDYGLRDQIRRSAVSVPSNIAEGDERSTDKDAVRFFYMAKGSLAELRTQLEIAHLVGYLDKATFSLLESQSIEIGKMLGALIKARSPKP